MLSNLKIRTGLLLMLLALSALALVATLFGLHSVREADDAMQRLNSLIAEQGRHVRAAYDASSRAVLRIETGRALAEAGQARAQMELDLAAARITDARNAFARYAEITTQDAFDQRSHRPERWPRLHDHLRGRSAGVHG